jgi:hypothetical protein
LIPAHIDGYQDSSDVLLMLDSGSNVSLLYTNNAKIPAWLLRDHSRLGSTAGHGTQMAWTPLPSEAVRIGSRVVREVAFFVPASAAGKVVGAGEDGLLPTALFKRVFISYSDHFVILDPR